MKINIVTMKIFLKSFNFKEKKDEIHCTEFFCLLEKWLLLSYELFNNIIIILKKERLAAVVRYGPFIRTWNKILRELWGKDSKYKILEAESLLVSEMLIKNFKYDALNSTYIDTTSKTINGISYYR